MTTLPPNQPNNNSNGGSSAKEQPFDGRQRRRQTDRTNDDGTMDAVGNLEDSPIVVAIFLAGVLSWFFRERCVC